MYLNVSPDIFSVPFYFNGTNVDLGLRGLPPTEVGQFLIVDKSLVVLYSPSSTLHLCHPSPYTSLLLESLVTGIRLYSVYRNRVSKIDNETGYTMGD